MSTTPNLGLPYLEAGQAQKHVTHNEALRALDALVQLAVLDRDLAAPPASPAEGGRWIVKSGASGAWAGRDNQIAAWQDSAWQFRAPAVGWVAYVVDEEILAAWDGAAWSEVSGGTGGGGGTREKLAANRTYYVRADGSDGNNGLSNTAGGAFLTIQKALNVCAALDLGTFNVTIQVADGTYTGANRVTGPWLGSGNVTVLGNTSAPGNVVINVTGGACFWAENGGRLTISGMELRTTTSGECVRSTRGGFVALGTALRFSTCAGAHIYADGFGLVQGFSNYSIVGSPETWHIFCEAQGQVGIFPSVITLTGTPAWGTAYVQAQTGGFVDHRGMTFSGTATGKRYAVQNGGVINSGGAGTTFYPGSVAGTGTSPGSSPFGLYI